MANKRRREIANGAPETTPITETSSFNTVHEHEPEPVAETPDPSDNGSPSGYEQLREKRMKENLERMQKLGIFQLSQKLNISTCTPPIKRPWRRQTPLEASRHSSRLENVKLGVRLENVVSLSYNPSVRLSRVWFPKVDLTKANLPKSDSPKAKLPKKAAKRSRGGSSLRRKGVKTGPEIYTEEDEKLLGSTELSWKLFVDGYGVDDGKRIYDPVNGKTCHQCRQKTLGHRTNCCECGMVQGQFCGDCLYMRYGEHIFEANKNPDWICPVCCGICNCSLCRKAKGWPATGPMYKKIAKSGYKSVAHYLVQTKRAPPETESEDKAHEIPHSAKRSLTFNEMEVVADGKEESHKKAISEQKHDCRDEENGDSKEEAVSSSEPNAGNSCKKPSRDATDKKLAQESVSQATTDKADAGFVASRTRNSCKKATDKADENEVIASDKKLAQESVSQATDKAEPDAGFVASRTRNSGKKANRDASEGCAIEACRKEKRYASRNAIQDSIASRLRPRIK